MKTNLFTRNNKSIILSSFVILTSLNINAQTNVFDDIIAASPNHTYLEAAILQEGLEGALQSAPNVTVFAPDDAAFSALASALNTDINGLLALPNLSDILLYHVIGSSVPSNAVNNGDIAQPLSMTNTLKLTKTSGGNVYANQAMVNGADLMADNGYVHSLNGVLLPNETVVDIAIDNGFSSLATAVITAELLPVLTNPLATLTVFAPTNQAFDDLATALGTDINGLLALPNLADVLAYHVLGTEVLSNAVTNGAIVQPLSPTNTVKMTVTSGGDVYANQATVTSADIAADNGVVHVLDKVILPVETVVDIAIDNNFTSLTAAVITAELLPALVNPLSTLTVFAPTNQAFDDLATALGTDINGLLANPELADILLYHVLGSEVLSIDLTNGDVATLNGQTITVDLSSGVMINTSSVITADLTASNGVVHVIDEVLVPSLAGINDLNNVNISIYPNPTSSVVTIENMDQNFNLVQLFDSNGQMVKEQEMNMNTSLDVSNLATGRYTIILQGQSGVATKNLQVVSNK